MRRADWLLLCSCLVLTACPAVAGAQWTPWTIPPTARDETSPLTPAPDILQKGKGIFVSKCQNCHGPEGKGDGPDSNPDKPAADLTLGSHALVNPDGVLFYKVWNGRANPKMPAFKSELTRDEVWTVVEYVKSLRK